MIKKGLLNKYGPPYDGQPAPIRYWRVQDNSNNWIISTQEMIGCINPDLIWVKDLDLIPFLHLNFGWGV